MKGEKLSSSLIAWSSGTFCTLDVFDCVRDSTFSLNSSISQDKMNSSLWSSNMASIDFGMCHTFTYKNKENIDFNYFNLEPNLNYRIFIHDPKYHQLVIRRLFPRILVQYNTGQNLVAGTYDYYDISITQHHLLNRPEQPCEEEEDYDFLECVKTSQARMVGCRPPWDIWSPHTIPLCQTMDQLRQYEKIDRALFLITRKKTFIKRTGCKVPCNYQVCIKLVDLSVHGSQLSLMP